MNLILILDKILSMKNWILLLFFGLGMLAYGQDRVPFTDDIEKFKKEDLLNKPIQNAILFVGSSSFTMWQDVGDYFPNKTIINRGFGGSSIVHLNIFQEDLLKPYNPKQIVIYCGENDFVAEEKVTVDRVFERYKKFYSTIRKYYPTIEVTYISIKLSPSRKEFWPKFLELNSLIKTFMKSEKNAHYVDITKVMEDKNGNVREDIFLEDMLHMKPEGYQLWSKKLKRYLK